MSTNKYRSLTIMGAFAGGLALGACCRMEDPEVAPIDDISLVSATGEFSLTSGELLIAVSPKDASGNFVGHGLPESAFAFENVTLTPALTPASPAPVAMEVLSVSVSEPDRDARLAAVVIFDSSGSMSSNDPGAVGRRAGGTAFFDILRSGDEVAVLDFGVSQTPPLTVSRMLQDFTGERALLDDALLKLQESGGTPLYRSVLDGLGMLEVRAGDVTALVVLTDGAAGDSASLDSAIATAQRLLTPVYAIGLGSSLNFGDLSRLAEETSGGFVEANDADALRRAFAGVSSGIRLGSVSVSGRGTYQLPQGPGRYRLTGDLVTVDRDAERLVTPFALTTDIQ